MTRRGIRTQSFFDSLRQRTAFFSRLGSFLLFVSFFGVFSFASIAQAQAIDRNRCINEIAYFYQNYNACVAAGAYNVVTGLSGRNKPPEQRAHEESSARSYAERTPSLGVTAAQGCAEVNGKLECRESVLSATAAQLLMWISQAPDPNGADTITLQNSQGEDVTVSFAPGAIGTVSTLTANLAGTPVISSREYIADVMNTIQNPLGAQTAYAQGLGFSSLRPTLELWKIFRNIAYFFFVVIFIVIGFMIMFRTKLGGQAAVTVQQALPKIVVSLLLVTFSYAIAGLMVDAMYLVIYLIIGVFTPLFPGGSIPGATGPISLVNIAFRENIISNTFGLLSSGVVGNISGALGNIVVGSLGLSGDQLAGAGLQGISNILFTLILAVVVLISLFRVFLELLKAYIGIFFSVIFSPIQLLLGALPGQNTFSTWLKGLLENLMVFPTIILLIFIAYYFSVGQSGAPAGQNLGFSAPQLSSNQGAQGFSVYQSLIALGAILAMPEVLKVTKGLMKGEVGVGMGDLGRNFKTGMQAALPLGGAAVGASVSGVRNVVRGRSEGTIRSFGDLRRAFRSGLKPGASAGMGYARQVGRTLDNLSEGRIFDPSDTANLLQNYLKDKERGQKDKAREEARKKEVKDPQ